SPLLNVLRVACNLSRLEGILYGTGPVANARCGVGEERCDFLYFSRSSPPKGSIQQCARPFAKMFGNLYDVFWFDTIPVSDFDKTLKFFVLQLNHWVGPSSFRHFCILKQLFA